MDGDAPAAILQADADGRYIDANQAALELSEVTLDELRNHRSGTSHRRASGRSTSRCSGGGADGGRLRGGTSTMVRPDGTAVRVDCLSIEKSGRTFRVSLAARGGESVWPHTDAVASVLEAWRKAEREIASAGRSEPEYGVAREAAESLRGVHHFVVKEKQAALAAIEDE